MINIANYQKNANRNYNEVSPHTGQNGIIKKSTNNKERVEKMEPGEGVEKREPSYTVGGNVNWCNHSGKQYGNCSES